MDRNFSTGPQRIENETAVTKKHPKKLKVRHLSELTKRIILDRYSSLMDFDEVAVAMEIPGLTGKTVANVIATFTLPTRKPPAQAVTVMSMRRTA
jgi:hypothetical protein